ncbi:MAG: quinone oxidoreductase [Hyphomonadaceae bacterium]|nr:quinone oxidoreductase [Hyphomonadaceae bacterium]
MKAIRIEATGGPEVMRLVEVETPSPGPGQIRIRQGAIGVNFIDTYHRGGLYPLSLPSGLGQEGAGVVDAVGEGVTRFKIGDRAGYCTGPIGGYAEAHVVAADRAVKLPEAMADEIAAASMLKGMTARFLLRKTFPVKQNNVVVVYSAAGGVGQIATQWAKHLGATVIGIVGSDAKAEIAKALGADHAIVSSREDIAKRVREITIGVGADVVYDSVGKDSFMASLDSLKPTGMMVSFGNSSGAVPEFSPLLLMQKGSLFLTRPTLFHYAASAEALQETADDLFGVIASSAVKIAAPQRYKLADAAQAHADLQARKTTGSVVLIP